MPDNANSGKARVAAPSARVMLRAEELCKDFDGFRVLDQVSLEVREGEVLGLLGPNGAGKTTALRILTGYFPPSHGRVWIEGEDLSKDPARIKRRVGYLPEAIGLYGDMRVSEFLVFAAQVKGVAKKNLKAHLEEKISRCGLWEVRRSLIGHLSKGYRQRLGLAQALVGDPDVLILDEPTNGLDPKQIIEIRTLLRELGRERTLILSTHILPEVNMVCDRVLILNQGRVVASGTTDELEAGLKERHQIFVVAGERFRKEEALKMLQELPGVERAVVLEEKMDQVTYSLETAKGQDVRPAVSRLFVERQIPLLEIKTGRLSLEEIFLKIVVSENPEGIV